MSMMETPVPRGNAYGWHRRHPVTAELSGIGDSCPSLEQLDGIYDPSDPCQGGGVVSGGYDPSGGGYGGGSGVDWASIIASGSQSLANILAITQGGSVTQSGVYGSQQTGNIAAGAYPANSLNVSGSGVSGFLSSPMVLLMVGAVVLIMVSKK